VGRGLEVGYARAGENNTRTFIEYNNNTIHKDEYSPAQRVVGQQLRVLRDKKTRLTHVIQNAQ